MKKITLLLCGMLLTTLSVFAQRVIGYVPSYGNTNNIQYDKITDLVYGFAELHTDGSITLPWGFTTVANTAKANAVKVHLSVGGDGASSTFPTVVASATAREKLATELANAVTTYGLAGVDIDWEFPASSKSWQLAEALKAIKEKIGADKELSVAVPALQYNSGAYTSQSDPYIDFYNLMAYDNTSEQNHSSYAFAQQSVNYWATSKGFDKSKFRLGLPFYARPDWGGAASAYNSVAAPNPATAYNSDSYNGWQYNGQTTIKNKCNYALNQGLDGVMVWELTQDRTDQYSLMNAIDEVMDAGIVCSEPKLGFTKSLCGVPSVELDADVSGTNFSYQWKKDGVNLSGATSKTYSASAVGEYCVDYIHTPSSGQTCPTKTACVEVQTSDAVEVENAEICGAGEVTLNVLTPGAYKWFTAASGGSAVHSGEDYTVNVSTTQTYYVEKPAVSETVGKTVADLPVDGTGTGDSWEYEKTKIIFNAETEFTIDYLTIYYYADQAGDAFTVTVYNKDGGVVGTSTPFTPAAVKDQRIPVGITVPAGDDYQLAVTGGALWIEKGIWGESVGFPYTKDGIISITGTQLEGVDDPIVHWYPGICEWEISAGASCGRTAITATVKSCTPPTASFTKPSSNVTTDGSSVVDFEVTTADADGTIASVTFEVKKDGSLYQTITGTAATTSGTYEASWTATESGTYTVEAIVIDNDEQSITVVNSNSITASIAAAIDPTVIFVKPSSNVTTDGLSAIDFEVTATDADGTIASVTFVVKKDGSMIETIVGTSGAGGSYTASWTATASGTYTVEATATDNSGASTTAVNTNSIIATVSGTGTGIDELAEYGVAVYPNPFNTTLTIDLGSLSNASIVMYDVQGQIVTSLENVNNTVVVGENIQSGIYVLQIVTDTKVVSAKIVKH